LLDEKIFDALRTIVNLLLLKEATHNVYKKHLFPSNRFMNPAIEVKDLVKTFGNIKALNNLSFQVMEREIYGLIGPNGAGKTTTLRILSTLILPDSGSARIFSYDVVSEAAEVRKIISYLPEEAGAYKNLSGLEYLRFMAQFYVENKEDLEKRVKEAAEISDLGERLKDRIKGYSKGMKRRLLVARSLMNKPRLAILDEPTGGLDVFHSQHVRRIIKKYAKEHGITVLLSSHNMLEVEYLCDRIALINKGILVEEGTPLELKERYNASNLEEAFMKVVAHA
jgi:ABC-2 type transport system ATP-binding protein